MNISKKKPNYPVKEFLHAYLKRFDRHETLPVFYDDLLHWTESFPLLDKDGKDTLWMTVLYPQSDQRELYQSLTNIYALLKTDGDLSVSQHLRIDRVDYCTFGNSKPFRIRVINNYNDNYDYFYVKRADASRVYGLELEHMLSPNRINYILDEQTLIEEHIAGIPGDMFIDQYLSSPTLNKVRIAKEFIKFNERCFVRLLGDMRSYNYVIDITPDFDAEQYRVRAIDFDQQSYEGRKNLYLPQFYKENLSIVELCTSHINPATARQYQIEERTLIARRVKSARIRLKKLFGCMNRDHISDPEKLQYLKEELNAHHNTKDFNSIFKMGTVVKRHIQLSLRRIGVDKLVLE